jgi:uncharacterized repeat protein (TIGR01451 family)
MRSLMVLIILVLTATALPAQSDVSLVMPGYRVSIAGPLAAGSGGFVVAQLDSLPKDRQGTRFGILVPSSEQSTVLEIQDGVSGDVLATVTAAQWRGRESSAWKRLASRSSSTGDRVEEAFQLQQGRLSATIVRTMERMAAEHLPLGVGLRYTVGVANASVPSVRVVLRGVLEGSATLNSQTLTVASVEKKAPMNAMVIHLWSEGATLRMEGAARSRTFVARSSPVTATSEAAVPALSVTVVGTTSPVTEHQKAQMEALIEHAKGQPVRPLLVARSAVDRPKASPGDTVQYSFTYYNVGTAPAAEVELSNPVPSGTRYVEASSSGLNCEIAVERETVDPPAVGRALQLTWKFNGAIAPGESRWASFRVVVQ